jgi:hypothetical protein
MMIQKGQNIRVRSRAGSITSRGFRIQVETWDQSKTWGLQVGWIASVDPNVVMGPVQVEKLHECTGKEYYQDIRFSKPLPSVPNVSADQRNVTPILRS